LTCGQRFPGILGRMPRVDFDKLPEQQLRRERVDDVACRVFREWDSDALWALARAAADAEHGTILVISERAAEGPPGLRARH
jgi:hypothetical protein